MMAAIAAIIVLVIVILVVTRPQPTTYSFSISPGTADALRQGKTPPNQLPVELSLRIGDTLQITNNDSVGHTYAFLVLRPGETGRYTFRNSGTFTASCTVGIHEEVTITVTE